MACRNRCRTTRRTRNFLTLDATCPLVTKVHREAEIHHRRGHEILLIGHAGHPEVIGTLGQLPEGSVALIETLDDARSFVPKHPDNLAYVTQTTLSIDDTAGIVDVLKARFPSIVGPHKDDICYATTNRQEAVKLVAPLVDAMIVVGAPNSSNSQRLKEVAERSGCRHAVLVQRAADIDWERFGAHRLARRHRRRVGAGGSGRRGARRVRGALRACGRDHVGGRRDHVFPAAAAAAAAANGGLIRGGLYRRLRSRTSRLSSPITISASCLSYKGIAEGVENSNFLLHTDAGYFILTLYEKRVAAADLPFFLGLMEHLAARGITCPQPVKTKAATRSAKSAAGRRRS